jgi:hypothetical protein
MQRVWNSMAPSPKAHDIAKVAVGLKAWPFEASDFSPYVPDRCSRPSDTDRQRSAAMRKAADAPLAPGHDPARRILRRDFYRVLYSPSAEDRNITLKPTEAIYRAVVKEFGEEFFAKDTHLPEAKPMEFAVETDSGEIVSSAASDRCDLRRWRPIRDAPKAIPENARKV